jgi:hypothetical protein
LANADAAAQRPPVIALAFDHRFDRGYGWGKGGIIGAAVTRNEIRQAGSRLQRSPAISHPRQHRRGGIFALVLAHLPLPPEKPGGVSDFGREAALQVSLVTRAWLQAMMNVEIRGHKIISG